MAYSYHILIRKMVCMMCNSKTKNEDMTLVCEECGTVELVSENALEIDSGDGRLIPLTLCPHCAASIANDQLGIDPEC